VINYLDIIKNFAISQLQKDLIIGTILGDASINKSGDSKAILRFEQGLCNKEYLYFLFEIMQEYSVVYFFTKSKKKRISGLY